MTGKRKALFVRTSLAAALALAACVGLSSRAALAKYMSDGAVQNGTTGGWVTPNDMVCVLGLHADGSLDVVSGVKNSRDCIYYTTGLTGMTMAEVTSTHAAVVKTAYTTYGTCKTAKSSYVWDFVNSRCLDVTACSGTDATTKGTLTWNAGDSKCYDSAACTVAGAPLNDGAKHALATSICVNASGAGVSLKDMDRTFAMCAAKGGTATWKQTSDTLIVSGSGASQTATVQVAATPGFGGACVAYGRQFAGQDASGTPLAFGPKGTVAAAGTGFCYAKIDTTLASATTCPSVVGSSQGTKTATSAAAFGYTASSSAPFCTYDYGTNGNTTADIFTANGTKVAKGAVVNFGSFATMGDCLNNGGSWANWIPSATTALDPIGGAATIMTFDLTNQAVNADEGCLHCHSTLTQYNGPSERSKDSYLKTGHKNMLRKVTAGKNWAGPDGTVYTQDTAGHAIDFTAGTVGGGALYFIFGDWMATYPNAVGPLGDTATYSCGACHTAGFKDNTNPGVQSIGTAGYTPAQPVAPYSAAVTAGHKWDLEGIQCSRCHNATVPSVVAAQISASSFTTTAPTNGGMGALAAGTGRNNLCFGCHQSIAKAWPAGTTQYDPTLIPTGVSHGAAAGRDFNGHVIGNSFLNSAHAKYAGVNSNSANGGIKLNSLGKYDLFDPAGTAEYASIFKGYTCWQSPSTNSPAKTKADGSEIKTKSECETLYGVGSWRADGSGDLGTQQGGCVTCHDVHNSLFVDEEKEAALRKTCDGCHVNNSTTGATDASAPQVNLATIGHPTGGGTPFDSTKYESPCIVCHMATQAKANGNQNSLPVHVWRINTSASYNTFPTTGQFYGGTCSVHTGAVQNAPSLPVVYLSDVPGTPPALIDANCTAAGGTWTAVTKDRNAQVAPDGTYTNAVWVDLDLACGQCHGGSLGTGASATVNNAPYLTKAELATYAAGMHNNAPTSVNFAYSLGNPNTLAVTVYAAADCGGTCGAFDWNWGDGAAHGSGASASHTYAGAGMYAVTLTVTGNGQNVSKTKSVAVYAPDNGPSVSGTACSSILGIGSAAWAASLTDNSTDDNGVTHVTVNWGDGSMLAQGGQGVTLTHAYKAPGTYTITHKALDSIGQQAVRSCTVSVAYFTIGGTVQAADSTLTPPATVNVPSAIVTVTNAGGVVVRKVYTAIDGKFSAGSLKPGTYTLTVTRGGYTFPAVAPITVGPSSTSNTVTGTKP